MKNLHNYSPLNKRPAHGLNLPLLQQRYGSKLYAKDRLHGGIIMYPQNQRIHQEYSLSPEDAYFQRERFNHVHDSAGRAVALIGSTLTTLLGLRFAFALLDANTTSGIVAFVNNITTPFVAPFYGLFNYDHARVGSVSFQGYTLVALFAYSIITAGIVRMTSITRY
jgi:hypothetical protein